MIILGEVVLYMLDETDAAKIAAWRGNFRSFNAQFAGHKHPHRPGTPGATGHIAHTGRDPQPGELCAATVVNIAEDRRLNLQVLLDGNDAYWATGVPEGTAPGTWQRRT